MTREDGFVKLPMSDERIGDLEKMAHDAFLNVAGYEPRNDIEHSIGFLSVGCTYLMAALEALPENSKNDLDKEYIKTARPKLEAALKILGEDA